MSEQAILERLDAHMARGNEHMARGNALMERIIATFDDNREFMRELTLRHERATREMIREIRAGREEGAARTALLHDLHEQAQDHTRAIVALIDELRSRGL